MFLFQSCTLHIILVISTLLKLLNLRFFEIDESWPYRSFKKKVRDMFHTRDRWFDDKHFFKGNWRRENFRCRLCELGTPDSDIDC